MLNLGSVDLEELAAALADQESCEHQYLVDPKTGEIAMWTSDTGLDGQTPIGRDELEDLALVPVEPLPSWVWYQDMADFAERVGDNPAGRRLAQAIQGKGAFRRFGNELHQKQPELLPAWRAFSQARAHRRAVDWLLDNTLIDPAEAAQYLAGHPDPPMVP